MANPLEVIYTGELSQDRQDELEIHQIADPYVWSDERLRNRLACDREVLDGYHRNGHPDTALEAEIACLKVELYCRKQEQDSIFSHLGAVSMDAAVSVE